MAVAGCTFEPAPIAQLLSTLQENIIAYAKYERACERVVVEEERAGKMRNHFYGMAYKMKSKKIKQAKKREAMKRM